MQKQILLIAIVLLAGALAVAQTESSKAYGTQPDTQQITNGPVAEFVGDTNATIGWSSGSSGTMIIKYGSDRAHLDQSADAVPSSDGRNYHARLDGLKPSTRYYFQVMQKDQPMGGVGTFHTVASGAAPIKSKATIPQ